VSRSDAELLGLVDAGAPGRFRFVVEEHLARMDARLYGGTAIAVSVAAAEAVTGKPALWTTTQFVSTAAQGIPVDVEVEVLAAGKRTNQVRVTGTDPDGAVVFASLGATGEHRDDGLEGVFEEAPTVAPPSDDRTWSSPFTGMAEAAGVEAPSFPRDRGFNAVIDLRQAELLTPAPGPGRVCMWVRRKDGAPITPAMAAFLADMVPMSVAVALGVFAGGTSLDNTIRIGRFDETEWVLLDLRPHLAAGGYAHGTAHVWSQDGRLLATASQTAAMRVFDLSQLPWAARDRREPPAG
jgi:acyl-CoA thioesterase